MIFGKKWSVFKKLFIYLCICLFLTNIKNNILEVRLLLWVMTKKLVSVRFLFWQLILFPTHWQSFPSPSLKAGCQGLLPSLPLLPFSMRLGFFPGPAQIPTSVPGDEPVLCTVEGKIQLGSCATLLSQPCYWRVSRMPDKPLECNFDCLKPSGVTFTGSMPSSETDLSMCLNIDIFLSSIVQFGKPILFGRFSGPGDVAENDTISSRMVWVYLSEVLGNFDGRVRKRE